MKKLIIFLISAGMLLLSSGARAEEIYLNCKFEIGNIFIKTKEYKINKGDVGTEDINIILDISRKRIIEAPSYYREKKENTKYDIGGHETTQSSSWSENDIKWSYNGITPSTGAKSSGYYNLNRRSGVLIYEQYLDLITEKSRMVRQNNCSKQDKKF